MWRDSVYPSILSAQMTIWDKISALLAEGVETLSNWLRTGEPEEQVAFTIGVIANAPSVSPWNVLMNSRNFAPKPKPLKTRIGTAKMMVSQ